MTTDPTVNPDAEDGWFITRTYGPLSHGGTEEMVVFRGPRPASPVTAEDAADDESEPGSGGPTPPSS